ncbi:MAG: carboxypeptidase regulatory-like domain-containing protein, partial [Planctomycetes bacterium]|nr:carboxypeptidase regulatory-like domain-containing protein [Planctomycetota bacterium]
MKTSTIAVSLGLALGLAAWVSFTNFGGESSVAPGMAGETQTETAALQPRRSVWHAPLDPQVAMPPAAGFAARVQVSGRVVGPRDEPIHSATIRLRTVGISTGGDEATATEPDGSFVLYRTPGRSAWLTVRADGYLDPPDRPLRVDDDGPLEIRLDAEPTVWGLVVAADTQRVLEAAVVTIIPDPDRRFAHEARVLRGAEAAAHLGQAPAPGLWASAGCGATALIVRARSDGHATTEFRVDDLRAGELRRADLVLEREVPGRGRVVDRDGSPIDG